MTSAPRKNVCPVAGAVGNYMPHATPCLLYQALWSADTALDRPLSLPEESYNDVERREQAKVPQDMIFQTKPGQAMATLTQACLVSGRCQATGKMGRLSSSWPN